MEQLSRLIREMMNSLASRTLDELLDQIARDAVAILGAETCGVFLVRDGQLSLEASFGHREGAFEKGKPLPIRPWHGLTGHIAYEQRLFNMHGEELKRHPAVADRGPSHTRSGRCDSLLALPLLRKRDGSSEPIGLIRVDNKKGSDGNPSPDLAFSAEDEWILTLFGDAVLIALEKAELFARLKEQQAFQECLIASSPDGIIAVDRKGNVTEYNDRAAEILGYTREEVLGRPVHWLYFDRKEPFRIGELLDQNGGRVTDYETAVLSKEGDRIPIRHSSTWLENAQGERTGSAGYFEDLRPQRLLLEASNLLATADHLDAGLQKLAEMIVSQLARPFCSILLADELGDSLILRATASLREVWKPHLGERFRFADWPGLRELLERGRPSIRLREDPIAQPHLDRLTKVLGCKRPIRSLLVAPLTMEGRVVGQLDLGDLEGDPGGPFTLGERHLVAAVASQITALVDRMRLLETNRRTFRQFAVLHRISDYIQTTDDLDKILRTILTGVTASYGLGFNRATLLMVDEADGCLIGLTGIGEVDEEKAREAWRTDVSQGLDAFERYLERLRLGSIPETTLGERVRGLHLQLGGGDPFSKVISRRKPVRIELADLDQLPSDFRTAFVPTSPLLLAPLVAKEQVLGVIAVDNKFTGSPIKEDLIDSLMTFTKTAAIILENKRLLQETLSGREKLLRYYEDSAALVALRDPEQILRSLVEQTYVASEAWGVSILLIDAAGRIHSPIRFGKDSELQPEDIGLIRPKGITREVMRTGRTVSIRDVQKERDQVNRVLVERGIGAALCLPLSLPGKRIGVMWIHYEQPRRFSDFEIGALQLYVNRAATAYDRARRMRRLERMAEAADALASADGTTEVLQRIADTAVQVLEADGGVVLWAYDHEWDNFLPDRSVTARIEPEIWEAFRGKMARKSGTAHRVLDKGRIEVEDTSHEPAEELDEMTRNFLAAAHSQSLQGVALSVGRESLGVLFALHRLPRSFDAEDEETARTFANHASLAFKKAKLLEQVRRAKMTVEAVAQLTALGDSSGHQTTLASIADATLKALDCGAVVIFECENGELRHPPAVAGVKYPERVEGLAEQNDYELVRKVLESTQPWAVEDVQGNPDFNKTRFTHDEKIESCVALPLKAPEGKIGVMFVNYRKRRTFTQDEISGIELFADQAAVAIRNARLFAERTELSEERTRQLAIQKKLAELSKELLGTTNLQETMDRAVAFAAESFGTDFCNIVLPDKEGRLIFSAAVGWEPELVKNRYVLQPGTASQTGYTIQEGRPIAVEDYSKLTEFEVPPIVFTHHIVSGLSAPMFLNKRLVGAIMVHTRTRRKFSEEDKILLSLIANHTAIAIESALRFGELRDEKIRVRARTAFGWVGIRATYWTHELQNHAGKIQNALHELRRQIPSELAEASQHLDKIQQMVETYAKGPDIPTRIEDEGVALFAVNQWVTERIEVLRKNDRYRPALGAPELALADDAMVRGSVDWLSRALDILVDNAIKYTRNIADRRIQIGTRSAGVMVEVFVTDNGPGIPDDILDKVFLEPIKKATGGTGLGIGLLTAYTIVDVYGGRLRCENLQPGTTMVISLPLR